MRRAEGRSRGLSAPGGYSRRKAPNSRPGKRSAVSYTHLGAAMFLLRIRLPGILHDAMGYLCLLYTSYIQAAARAARLEIARPIAY